MTDSVIDVISVFNLSVNGSIKSTVPVVDCRSKHEYQLSHIPFALGMIDFTSYEDLWKEIQRNRCKIVNTVIIYSDDHDVVSLNEVKKYFLQKNCTVLTLDGGFASYCNLFGSVTIPGTFPPRAEIPSFLSVGNLFLGGIKSADLSILSALGVKSVLNAGTQINKKLMESFVYKKLIIDDSTWFSVSLEPHVTEGIEFIRENLKNGRVFVHCRQGISRSVSIVIAYFMREHGYTYDDALKYVQSCRPVARPNYNFELQLQAMQSKKRSNDDTDDNVEVDNSHSNRRSKRIKQ